MVSSLFARASSSAPGVLDFIVVRDLPGKSGLKVAEELRNLIKRL